MARTLRSFESGQVQTCACPLSFQIKCISARICCKIKQNGTSVDWNRWMQRLSVWLIFRLHWPSHHSFISEFSIVFQALSMLVSPNTMLLGWRGEFTHWKQTPHHRHRDSASQKLLVLFAHVPLFVWLTLCGIKQSAMIAYRWSLSLHVQNCRAVKRERARTSRSWLFILSNVPHISVHHMSISKCLLVAVQTCRSLAFSPGAIRRAQAYGRAPRLKLIFQALSRGWKVQIYKRQWSTVDLVQLKPE